MVLDHHTFVLFFLPAAFTLFDHDSVILNQHLMSVHEELVILLEIDQLNFIIDSLAYV